MRRPLRKQAAAIITDRCEYIVDDVLCWGFEVTVKAKFEGSRAEHSFTSRPFRKLSDAIEMVAKNERKLAKFNTSHT